MLDGVMLLWFVLTGASVVYVLADIRGNPSSPVLKWAFILVTAATGPIGAFLYVLGCREPLRQTHEDYISYRWKQVLGSTMHCVAGDGAGILAGALVASAFHLPAVADVALEYALGFGFGWSIFQALFMRASAGGSFMKALRTTFLPELVSMNLLMAAMIPVAGIAKQLEPAGHDPSNPEFWFFMSMALMAGFVAAYPVNWWLVAKGLKHGMMTVREERLKPADAMRHGDSGHDSAHGGWAGNASATDILLVTLISFTALGLGIAAAAISVAFGVGNG